MKIASHSHSTYATPSSTEETHDREQTAYHEAGHAVLAFLVASTGLHASVKPDGDTLGVVQFEFGIEAYRPRTAIAIWLAGPAAQAHLLSLREFGCAATAQNDRDQFQNVAYGQSDLREACTLAKRTFTSRHEAKAAVHSLRENIAQLFASRPAVWRAVEVLAAALLEHGELRGCHLAWLIRRALYGSRYLDLQTSLRHRVTSGRSYLIEGHVALRFRRFVETLRLENLGPATR